MNNSEYTTYLIINIPRNRWKEIRMLCLDEGVKVNDFMLTIIDKVSKGKITVD